jgi:hypothetical protein
MMSVYEDEMMKGGTFRNQGTSVKVDFLSTRQYIH